MKNTDLIAKINKISIPLMFTSVTSLVMGMIDQIFVGHISIESFAGVGLVVSVLNCIVGVLGVLSVGLVIQFFDSNESERDELIANYYVISLMIGFLFMLIIGAFSNPILKIGFGLRDKTLYEGAGYLKIYSVSFLLNMQIFVCNAVFKIQKKTGSIFFASLAGNVVNIILDYLLIFGKQGFPKLGTTGAAISTVIALMVTLLFEMTVILKRRYIRRINCVTPEKMRDIIKYNIPLIAQELLEGVVLVFLTNMIVGRMGAVTLSIFNISQQLINIVLMPAYGYSSAINVLINDDEYNKKDVAKTVIEVGAAAYFILALIVYANRYTILSFFGEDYRGIDSASIIILVSIIIQGINYIFVLFRAMLQSMGEAEWILKITCLINIIISLCMILFAKNLISLYLLLGMNYFAISVSSVRRIKRSLHNEI